MKFFERIGNACFALAGKSLSPDLAAWARGDDVDANGNGAKLVNPYSQSAWVYTAISILASSIAQIPFRISRMDSDKAKRVRSLRGSADPAHRKFLRKAMNEKIIESGDIVDLFNRPHPTMDRQLFWEMVVTWFAMRGEFFVVPLDAFDTPVDLTLRGARVKGMLALEPALFWHIVQGYELMGWRYTGSPLLTPLPSETLLPSEVVHSRSPNPYLYWRGLSPIIVAAVPTQTDFAGEQFQKGLWINNADTGVVVTTEQQATPEQQAAILAALKERKRKAGTADRPLFLWGGAKVDKPTLSMMDMQYLETRKFLRQEIFAIFKVPQSMAGFTEDLNDGGAGGSLDAAKISFIESTVGALCSRLEAGMDPIVKTFGDEFIGWFDIDSLPIMQAARRSRWDTGAKMFGMGVPVDDINTSLDLGLPDRDWYRNGYLPFNLQIAGEPAEPLPSEDNSDDGQDAAKSNPLSRAEKFFESLLVSRAAPVIKKPDTKLIWEAHVNSRRKSVNLFKAKAGKVLLEFRGKTLAKLAEIHLEKSSLSQQRSLVDLVFSPHEFGKKLFSELTNPITATLQLAGDELNQEVGKDDPWQMPPQKAKDFLAGREQKIQGVGGTVRDQLNTSLQQGLDAGETSQQLADRVRGVFNNLNEGEARRVAQTEVNTAYNSARHDAMSDAGIESKAWLSSHGPHVRPAHAEAELFYIDAPIALDEPFIVGGEELMYPGDDSLGASAGNIINCQCIQLAAQPKSEDEKTMTFKIFGAGEMTFDKPKGAQK